MIEIFMASQPMSLLTKITEWTIVGDPAVAQYDCAVDQGAERANIMQHNQYACAPGQQPAQHLGKHPLMVKINTRRGFIEHQEIWFSHQRARNQHPLLLPTRQPGNVVVQLLRQADLADRLTYRISINR